MHLRDIEKSPCYRNWRSAEYHAQPQLSRSRLWSFYESARKYRAEELGEIEKKKPTDSMKLGSLVHAMLFEPDELKDFKIIPVELLSVDGKMTTKAAKQFIDDYADKTVVTQAAHDTAVAVIKSLMASQFKDWIAAKDARKELSIVWQDEETGLDLRCRVDLLLPSREGLIACDLKTTDDASPESFRYSIKDWGYWLQYAMYCDGIRHLTGEDVAEWFFIAAGTKTFENCFHKLDPETKRLAHDHYREALHDYADAKASGVWLSSWDNNINTISLRPFEF